MTRPARNHPAIAARRAFALPGYVTLAQAGFDGDYVSPIQITSGNLTGPLLISKDWMDAPSAARHADMLRRLGYLPQMVFNKVLDRALALAGLTRADIHVSPIFCLLPPSRSHPIPLAHRRASFEAVVQHDLLGRRPVAAGRDAVEVLRAANVDHVPTIHPSARGLSFEDRARHIATALEAA